MNRSEGNGVVAQSAIVAATMLVAVILFGWAFAPRTPAQDAASRPAAAKLLIRFDSMELGKPPAGFTIAKTGTGAAAAWSVVDDPSSQGGGRVVAQTSTDDDNSRFPLCVLDGWSGRDVSVSVRFKPVAGALDRAGGLVARLRDQDNYYLVRANALEDNVRLYRVVAGKRIQFAGKDHVTVKEGAWHTLRLDVRGKRFRVWFDGEFLYEAEDDTFADAGKVGLWTKADSVTHFDDLEVSEPGIGRSWDFENVSGGVLPQGLVAFPLEPRTPASKATPSTEWLSAEDPTSPRGKTVMRSRQVAMAARNAGSALLDDPTVARDVAVSVSFKTLGGESEARIAGLVARYQDASNYYWVRINTREDNIQLWRVADGKWKQIGEIHHKLIAEGAWHSARLEAKGTAVTVFLDGMLAIEATDDVLQGAGKAGIWGSWTSVTSFDGLLVEALGVD